MGSSSTWEVGCTQRSTPSVLLQTRERISHVVLAEHLEVPVRTIYRNVEACPPLVYRCEPNAGRAAASGCYPATALTSPG